MHSPVEESRDVLVVYVNINTLIVSRYLGVEFLVLAFLG
jgi:hypothetical protein